MKKLNEVLINIPEVISGNLKCSVSSIHKIKHDENYEKLISKESTLKDAAYVVYSNYNAVREAQFLDVRGGYIGSLKGLNQNLIYDKLDFEIDYYDITENHPFTLSLNNISDKLNFTFG